MVTATAKYRARVDVRRSSILALLDALPPAVRWRFRNVRFVLQTHNIRGRWQRPDYELARVHLADARAAAEREGATASLQAAETLAAALDAGQR